MSATMTHLTSRGMSLTTRPIDCSSLTAGMMTATRGKFVGLSGEPQRIRSVHLSMHDAVHMRVSRPRQYYFSLVKLPPAFARFRTEGANSRVGIQDDSTLQRGASVQQVSRLNPTVFCPGVGHRHKCAKILHCFLVTTHWELWIAGYGPILSE